jgi:uncharacterized membrane protein (DUF485 family)
VTYPVLFFFFFFFFFFFLIASQHKYIPYDVGVSEEVSRSLDFAFADVAVAKAASVLAAAVHPRRRKGDCDRF